MVADTDNCSICKKRESFYARAYSGERLCRKCFVKSIEERARATISRYGMLKFDDKLAVAVSGGKDSVSLLHVLMKLERNYPKASLTALTIDEGIAGYREEALNIAAENCQKLGVHHFIFSFKELYGLTLDEIIQRLRKNGETRLSTCACCGVLRRKALNIAARRLRANKIVTAHNLDDEAQTVLLNIFHGDVMRIAREKPVTDLVHSKFVQRIKPFCEIPERETALYAFLKKIRFQSTRCPYASEALRNDVRKMLNLMEEKHVGLKFTVLSSIERVRPALEELDRKSEFRECSECGEPTSDIICNSCRILSKVA